MKPEVPDLYSDLTRVIQQFCSQHDQDRYIYEHFFIDKLDGIFVDIGAHNGISFSNTYFFEKTLGWSGLCIEPIPQLYDQLKRNRDCICIQGCIFESRESVPFLQLLGGCDMLSGIIENYHPMHQEMVKPVIDQFGAEIIQVKCYSLPHLFIDYKIERIDYLSIDTEGGELDILRSIDFAKTEIDVISVENPYQTPIQDFMEPLGYKKMSVLGSDEIYKKYK